MFQPKRKTKNHHLINYNNVYLHIDIFSSLIHTTITFGFETFNFKILFDSSIYNM